MSRFRFPAMKLVDVTFPLPRFDARRQRDGEAALPSVIV